MSGPKKADVEAQLNIARNSQRKCANLLAGMEEATTAGILREVDSILNQAAEVSANLRRELEALTGDLQRVAPEAASSARAMAAQVQQELDKARAAVMQARQKAEEAERLKRRANETFVRAEREYERAAEATRRAGSHYLRQEMEWAKQAQALFDQAASELAAAAQARREAERAAVEALQRVKQAHASATGGYQQARAARSEAEARRRAEEEARRIAEQQRREAMLAVEQARAAFNRLAGMPHNKFCPGEGASIERGLEAAARALAEGRFPEATAAARRIPEEVRRLEEKVRQAQQEYERRRAEAEAAIGALAAAIDSADERLVAEWADDPQALERARQALRSAQQAVALEHFPEAARQAQTARQVLAQALNSAAENKSADEKRQIIGQAVMDVLEELGFDVSFEPGSRTEPMRISGQTPDPTGKGDFDIALPLEGEVNFEVNTPPGDTTCIAAVQELQKRLAERGIRWETTDWGHAAGAAAGITTQQKVKQTEKQKVKGKA
jgi:hypothetical protein